MKYVSLFIAIIVFAACRHSPNMILVPICDTTATDYKQDIQPIFSANCYSCHATSVTLNGGLDLQDTASLRHYLSYDFRGNGIYGSKLYHCMLHAQLALPMPPTYVIDSCSLKKISHWLNIGAPMH